MPEQGTARVPDGTRVYAVGDIHGRADLLEDLLALIAADMDSFGGEDCTVVFLGDYLNRGPGTREVIGRLAAQPLLGARHVFLRGNHDALLLNYLDDPGLLPTFLRYGGSATLASYGVQVADPAGRVRPDRELHRDFLKALPADHLEFLKRLALYSVIGDYLFVHAGIRPGLPLGRQSPVDLISIREPFLSYDGALPYVVVHGHTRVPEPVVRPARIGIDTGAFKTGRLTSLVLEGSQRRFLATAGAPAEEAAICG